MALFTDGTISSLEDLRGYESSVYDLASTERIDLTQKLILAQQELEVELVARFFRDNPGELAGMVTTPAVRLWHTFLALAIVYRDAYNSHLNDRYQGKWREYERLARWALENVLATGVGMVSNPVPKAPPPQVSAVPGDGPAVSYWIQAAWFSPAGGEGCASEPRVLEAPEGTVPAAELSGAPDGVSGWNIYAGLGDGPARLQNEAPLPLGMAWAMPPGGLVEGRTAGSGQAPSYYRPFQRVFRRG